MLSLARALGSTRGLNSNADLSHGSTHRRPPTRLFIKCNQPPRPCISTEDPLPPLPPEPRSSLSTPHSHRFFEPSGNRSTNMRKPPRCGLLFFLSYLVSITIAAPPMPDARQLAAFASLDRVFRQPNSGDLISAFEGHLLGWALRAGVVYVGAFVLISGLMIATWGIKAGEGEGVDEAGAGRDRRVGLSMDGRKAESGCNLG